MSLAKVTFLYIQSVKLRRYNQRSIVAACCANYNDVILLVVSTKKVTLARFNIYSLMMVRTDRNMKE